MPISHLQLSEIYNPPAPFTVVPCTSLTKKSATATELRVFKGRFRRPPNFSCFSVLDNKSSQRDCDSSAQSSSFPQLISKGSGLLRNKIDLVAPDTKGVAFKPPLSLCRSPYGNGLRRGTVGKDVEDKGPEQESRDFKGKAQKQWQGQWEEWRKSPPAKEKQAKKGSGKGQPIMYGWDRKPIQLDGDSKGGKWSSSYGSQ